MNDDTPPPVEPPEINLPEGQITLVEPEALAPAEVEFVVPAEAYESLATDPVPAALVSDSEPASSPLISLQEVVEAIGRVEQSLSRRLDSLQAQFDREIRAETTREKVVDRLHAELQEYKQDLLLSTLKPIFLDLIQLHDDIGKIIAAAAEPAAAESRLLEQMRGFQQGVEDILYRQGVEAFSLDSDEFDARRQRAAATVPANDPSLSRRVCARLRKGFASGEKVIRPEVVSVYAPPRG